MNTFYKALALVLALGAGTTASHASGITFVCSGGISTSLCNSFNTVIGGEYASIFTNANATVSIAFNPNVGLAETVQYLFGSNYSTVFGQLKAVSSGDAIDKAAIATLTASGEPAQFAGAPVIFTSALGAALGYTGFNGIVAGTSFASCPTINTTNCFNADIFLDTPDPVTGILVDDPFNQQYYYRVGAQPANSYDIFGTVEHELDEVLGTSSCISTNSSNVFYDACGGTDGTVADLFRYNANGTQSLISASGGDYFSYDGGVTHVGPPYNNIPGGDYADFAGSCLAVQDAFGCLGKTQDISTDGGSEIKILDAVGYNLTPQALTLSSTPEPGSVVLLGTGLASVAGMVRRRIRRA